MTKQKVTKLNDGIGYRFTPNTEYEIKEWIRELIAYLEEKAGGKVETRKFDPNSEDIDDIFYFTKCQDILKDDPNGEKPETIRKMWRRKGIMFAALLLRWSIGEDLDLKKACRHCGHEYMKFTHLKSGGHAEYCEKCGITKTTVYPETLEGCFGDLKELYFKQFGKKLKEAGMALDKLLRQSHESCGDNKEPPLDNGLCPYCCGELKDYYDEENHAITYECQNCDYKYRACFISDKECKKLQKEARKHKEEDDDE